MVNIAKGCGPSGRALRDALIRVGYSGKTINFGSSSYIGDGLNSGQAVRRSANKELALQRLRDEGVPTPTPVESVPIFGELDRPIVGRTTFHKGGKGFFLCKDLIEVAQARLKGATHFMEYIGNAREFRVHVVGGKSIKMSEKLGGGITKNYEAGGRFSYPHDFEHKDELRDVGKRAVGCMGLDFGAVDILFKDGKFYVLEVNTAPRLTDTKSDTLERYVQAFVNLSRE